MALPLLTGINSMARYLVSLNTGVVLPYIEASLKSPGVRELTSEEAATYEASVKSRTVKLMDITPVAQAAAAPILNVAPASKPVSVEVVTQDFADGEPDVEAVLGALGVE